MSINIDGNLHALRQYEREQDALQRMDDLLEAFIDEVWDSETCLLNAIENAPSTDMPISDAVELEARRMIDQMMREREV